MSLYDTYVLPHLINCCCGMKDIVKQRQKVVPQASGRVLEVGMGSGLNLEHYDPEKVEFVWGLEPSEGMRRKAQKNLVINLIFFMFQILRHHTGRNNGMMVGHFGIVEKAF